MRTLVALLIVWMGIVAMPAHASANTPDCSLGTLVTVVVHLDDNLLFVNPGISDKPKAG